MARFKNKDLRLDTNEEVLLGDSQEASLSYDGADLVSSLAIYAATAPTKDQHLTNKTFVDGEISDVRDYVDEVIKGLEWQDSVLSITQNVPVTGGEGDRYIAIVPSGASYDPDNTHAFITLSNENLTTTCTNTGSWISAITNTFLTTGKWYWEVTIDVWPVSSFMPGIARTDMSTLHFPGQIATGVGYYDNTGQAYYNGTPTAYGDAYSTPGDVIGVALDLDNGKVFFSLNDVWQNSGDPVAGTNPAQTITPAEGWGPAIGLTTNLAAGTMNVGATSWAGTLPTGYTAVGDTGVDWFNDDVLEWETSSYTITTPSAGFATWVIDEAAYYIYSGSSWSRMGSVIDHSVLDNLDVDDHTQYVLADGTRGMTSLMVYGTTQSDIVSAGTFTGAGWNHGTLAGISDDDHTQYLLADGSRLLTGTQTVSAGSSYAFDIFQSEDGSGGGIRMTQVSDPARRGLIFMDENGYLELTTVTGNIEISPAGGVGITRHQGNWIHNDDFYMSFGTSRDMSFIFKGSSNELQLVDNYTVDTDVRMSWDSTGDVTFYENLLPDTASTGSIGTSALPFSDVWVDTLHTSGGTVHIGDARLYEIGGTLYSETAIVAPSGSDPNSLVTNQVLIDERGAYGLGHDHDADYYTQALLDGGQLDGLYYTQTAADLAFAPLSHNNTNHSDTYITATDVTYGNLDGAGDIGTGSDQVSQGDHSHGVADGVWILIEKQIASNDNTIDFTGISGYSKVFFTLEQVVPGNDVVDTCMRVYTGASTLQTGAIYTSAEFIWTNAGGTGANGETNGTVFYLTEHTSVGSAANEYGVSGEVKFWGFNGSKYKHATTHLFMWRSDGYNVGITGAGRMATTTALTGVQFYFTAGVVESGTICCYGIKDA